MMIAHGLTHYGIGIRHGDILYQNKLQTLNNNKTQ
jgi:hypothetical protein